MSEEQPENPPPVLNYRVPGAPSDSNWKTVWTARNPAEANLAVARLQELGLHARVDMEASATLGPWAGVVGGTNVQVIESDAPAAREILLEIDQRRERRQQAMVPPCPKCGAAESKRVMSNIRRFALACIVAAIITMVAADSPLVFLALLVAGPVLLLWPLTARWRCPACGHRWIAPEPEIADDDEDDDEDD
jgi:hypothetical protein